MTAAIQSAGVLRRVQQTPLNDSIRNVAVNSDVYLMKSEDSIPADEKFFHRFVSSSSS